MPPIPGEWLIQGGAAALLGVVVWMILTDRLVPGRRVRQLEKERDMWQSVAVTAMGHADALIPGAQVAAEITKSFADATTAAITPPREGRAT